MFIKSDSLSRLSLQCLSYPFRESSNNQRRHCIQTLLRQLGRNTGSGLSKNWHSMRSHCIFNGDIYLGFVVPLQKSLQQGKAQHFLTRTNTNVDSPIHGLSGSAQSLKHVEILPFNSLKALRFEKTEALNTTTESKRIFVKLNLSIAVQGSLLQRT